MVVNRGSCGFSRGRGPNRAVVAVVELWSVGLGGFGGVLLPVLSVLFSQMRFFHE